MARKKKYARGEHPASKANLRHEGRPPDKIQKQSVLVRLQEDLLSELNEFVAQIPDDRSAVLNFLVAMLLEYAEEMEPIEVLEAMWEQLIGESGEPLKHVKQLK